MPSGALSEDVRLDADGKSGAYAIRRKGNHEVLYVGESHTARLWKTMLRHFHGAKSFRKVRESFVAPVSSQGDYEVALWVTARDEAQGAQADWIKSLRPSLNVEDGLGHFGRKKEESYEGLPEEEFYATNPRKPIPKAERRAAADVRAHVARRVAGLRRSTASDRELVGWTPRLYVAAMPAFDGGWYVYDVEASGVVASFKSEAVARRVVADLEREALDAKLGADKRPNPSRRTSPNLRGAAMRKYVETHWGEGGSFVSKPGEMVDPHHGALVLLGDVERVTYSTKKGDDGELVNYEHDFGRRKPALAFHVCEDPKCEARGKLAIVGGAYRVTERGIVG